VFGKYPGVFGEQYRQEMRRVCHRKADASRFLSESRLDDARHEE